MDLARIEAAVREILLAVGEDPTREGLQETPARVARMYSEVFASLGKQAEEVANYKTFHVEERPEMVLVQDIPFYSMCEHHLLPFFGVISLAYVPNDRVIGLSKIPRLVDYVTKKPGMQERVTTELLAELDRLLAPAGVAVSVAARHMCMEMRGVHKTGQVTYSSRVSGQFATQEALRQEFLQQVRTHHDQL